MNISWKHIWYFLVYNPIRNLISLGILLITSSIFLMKPNVTTFLMAYGICIIFISIFQGWAKADFTTKLYEEDDY